MITDGTYRGLARGYHLPDGSRRIYCYHVRKTAGTSLMLAMMSLGGEDPTDVYRRLAAAPLKRTVTGGYAIAGFHRRVLAEGAYFFGRSHRPASDQPLKPGTFTVTILRDPVERVHSYFDYLVAGDAPDMPRPVALHERSLAANGFDRFLDVVPDHLLLGQLVMFSVRSDISEAVDRIAACSSVLVTEEYRAGLAALGGRLGLDLVNRRDRATGLRSVLSDRQRDRLASRLEPEYELLSRLKGAGIVPTGQVHPT